MKNKNIYIYFVFQCIAKSTCVFVRNKSVISQIQIFFLFLLHIYFKLEFRFILFIFKFTAFKFSTKNDQNLLIV